MVQSYASALPDGRSLPRRRDHQDSIVSQGSRESLRRNFDSVLFFSESGFVGDCSESFFRVSRSGIEVIEDLTIMRWLVRMLLRMFFLVICIERVFRQR